VLQRDEKGQRKGDLLFLREEMMIKKKEFQKGKNTGGD